MADQPRIAELMRGITPDVRNLQSIIKALDEAAKGPGAPTVTFRAPSGVWWWPDSHHTIQVDQYPGGHLEFYRDFYNYLQNPDTLAAYQAAQQAGIVRDAVHARGFDTLSIVTLTQSALERIVRRDTSSELAAMPPRPMVVIMGGNPNDAAFADTNPTLERMARQNPGLIHIVRARGEINGVDLAQQVAQLGIQGPYDVMISDHGSERGFGSVDDQGRRYSASYAQFFRHLPDGLHGVMMNNCYSGAAHKAADFLPPGSLAFSGTTEHSVTYADKNMKWVLERAPQLTASETYLSYLTFTDFEKLAERNARDATATEPSKKAINLIPNVFSIAGYGQVDLNVERARFKDKGVSPEAIARVAGMRGIPGIVLNVAEKIRAGEAPTSSEEVALAHALTFAEMERNGDIVRLQEQARTHPRQPSASHPDRVYTELSNTRMAMRDRDTRLVGQEADFLRDVEAVIHSFQRSRHLHGRDETVSVPAPMLRRVELALHELKKPGDQLTPDLARQVIQGVETDVAGLGEMSPEMRGSINEQIARMKARYAGESAPARE